jgi:hypothetical protein
MISLAGPFSHAMLSQKRYSTKDDNDLAAYQHSIEQEKLPPPISMFRTETGLKASNCRMVVAAKSPYLILATSSDLRDVLQLSTWQLCDRSINVICGPETNKRAIITSIKNLVADSGSQGIEIPMISIYGKSGQRYDVMLTCAVHERSEDGAVSSCCLSFKWDMSDLRCLSTVSVAQPNCNVRRRGSLPSTRAEYRARYKSLAGLEMERNGGSLPSTRGEYRARYNFLTGLEMERELLLRLKQEAGAASLAAYGMPCFT